MAYREDMGSEAGSTHVTPARSTALLTDRYELTMVQAALTSGAADRHCVFEAFSRRLPAGRRYGVVAGTGRILEALERFSFTDDELSWLARDGVVNDQTLDFLANYRFTGSIRGYAEGEVYFPGSPVLMVEGTFAEAVLLETLVLSILNYDSAIAAAASRMTAAAGSRPCLEMGSRRAHERAAVSAARAAVVGGFAATSNLEAGRRYNLTTIGTAAHSFTLLHDDEEAAFAAQVASLGVGTTLLVDTYDVTQGVDLAIKVAGTELGAVRLDSGDLGQQAVEVRAQLDALGAHGTQIVVTSDLDEYAIAALASAPVDSYGVGTSLVTGSGVPTCGMVYKIVSRENDDGVMEPVEKRSAAKASVGGRKSAARAYDPAGKASAELIVTGPDQAVAAWTPGDGSRALIHDFVTDGVIDRSWTGAEAVLRASEHHRMSRAELPRAARRMSSGDPALPTQALNLS